MLSYPPVPGDDLRFHSDVYVDNAAKQKCPTREGRFVSWADYGGDTLAVVATALGQVMVRWSMIEGIESPVGLRRRTKKERA